MSLRFGLAKAVGAASTKVLRGVFHRPAANTPGKIALRIDPQLIADLRSRIAEGSVVVVGTNGKTTTTNLLADVMERAGKRVVCNRTGANLSYGVASALMQCKGADWGVIECDELWLARVLPQLRPRYVVLLNLFRDQLDRFGEIDRLQDSIVSALASSPETALIYNADDPLCEMIAQRAAVELGRAGTPSFPFGVEGSMGLAQNVVSDATMCQRCSSMFAYDYRQYGQLGLYRCPNCGFARSPLAYAVRNVKLGARESSFDLVRCAGRDAAAGAGDLGTDAAAAAPVQERVQAFTVPFSGAYMVYNLAAVATAADLLGCDPAVVQQAANAFNPHNGRLQDYAIAGRHVLLNLAKNPTGFNQNLKIVAQDTSPKAVAFFINDKTADGHDISWIWDIDFEELVSQEGCTVFAGGIRKNDLQVRLKYAGVRARLVDSIDEVFAALPSIEGLPADAPVYAIANYTALPAVHDGLDRLAAREAAGDRSAASPAEAAPAAGGASASAAASATAPTSEPPAAGERNAVGAIAPVADARPADAQASSGASAEAPLVIAHMFPDLLNLYGDGGNVRALEQRCRWRGIPVEVRRVMHGETVNLDEVDLVFMGGGPDREQKLASAELMRMRNELARFVEEDGALLAICGGYQILGSVWLLGDEEVSGLSIVDIETRRPGTSADRLIDNVVLRSEVASRPVVGYENHAGRTFLGAAVESFGSVISQVGKGNNDEDGADGIRYRNVIGTYLHGPLLPKNPEAADWLLRAALERRAARTGAAPVDLAPLDDAEEIAANAFMCKRLGVGA